MFKYSSPHSHPPNSSKTSLRRIGFLDDEFAGLLIEPTHVAIVLVPLLQLFVAPPVRR
jgi:hypothetical protein